ncbi:hypothetical protein BKA58DRAFT_421047 [Alternaria rosae]|uniref:uncharacterized protein n=1 Tax=Alternaria rosae TaxID=1187941 RepID=UPI001E8E191C|nr:uncharacterized protein BKA58DRAFT_421047 [Alternaria rosae]KAH6870522.1 hypothetical protein BKA58DRAFT_421047 [Alternaria rosae]
MLLVKRGHAERLVSYCTQLADLDDASLGVSATPCGATVVSKAGFQERDCICYTPLTTAQAGTLYPAGFELWIGVRLPGGKVDSVNIVTYSESPITSQSATSSV